MRAVVGAPLIDDSDPTKPERACSRRRAQHRADHRGRRGAGRARRSRRTRSTRVSERRCAWIAERAAEREIPVADPPLGDAAGGRRLPRRDRHAARRTTSTRSACSGRGRCSPTASGSTRAELRPDRRARGDRGHEPGREPEAGGRRACSPTERARERARRPVGLGHRRRRARTTRSTCSTTRRRSRCPEARWRPTPPPSPPPRRWRSPPARRSPLLRRRRRAADGGRRRPTSCSSAPTPPSWPWATSSPASSTRPRARSSTRRSSPAGR